MIKDISDRSNIIFKETEESDVAIYEDHRTILNVLFYLKTIRKIDYPLDIIMFDDHDDFLTPSKTTIRRIRYFLKNPTIEKLFKIVEFDLSGRDDDWVKAGMELGLIGNVFLFNSTQSSISYEQEYQTKEFGIKKLYNMGNIWGALGYHGLLSDTYKEYNRPIWDDFGWELKDFKFRFKENRNKYIFDIDLDCFSTNVLDKTISIPKEVIIPKLTEIRQPHNHNYYDCQSFMRDLIIKSELVTICFESGCCGGIRQAYKNFNIVDYLFFNNKLGE